MSFWPLLQEASHAGSAFVWLALLFFALALILYALLPRERLRIRTAIVLYVLSLIGLLLAAFAARRGDQETTFYRWTVWASLLLQGISFVAVLSSLIFDMVFAAIRLRPPRILRDLLLAFAYIVVAINSLWIIKVDVTGIVATSAVITAVIGLSFQDTLGNMMGGMALQMERAIGVGDWIRVDEREGLVKEIRWRHTAIETRNWDTVIIPNSVLMKSQVLVLGRRVGSPRQHRQWVHFNVDFRYPPPDVIDAVQSALRAEAISNIAPTPMPDCIFLEFKESYARYAVRYWLTDLAADDPTNSVVRTRIYFALRRANVPFSIPSQSIFVIEEDATRQQKKLADLISDGTQALTRLDLFASLTDEERSKLAAGLMYAPFVRGEAMTRQGAEAHWLYLISKGDAEVRVSVNGGKSSERVATLSAGDFFGEMGLMTGAKRSATVIALTDVECYRLDKDTFRTTIESRPEIAKDISEVLARRKVELEATREGLNEESKKDRLRRHQSDLLQRIQSFFTLESK
jgi:small-conductance mechanosensitive channel/CRP-like cAMP-binding protein